MPGEVWGHSRYGAVLAEWTLVWWGDGYMVYHHDKYLGKDDQIDLIDDIIVASGVGEIINAEDHEETLNENWGVPLPELKEALSAETRQ